MEMFEVFRKYLAGKIQLTEDDYTLIKSVAMPRRVRKRQYVIQEGELWDTYIFVCDGCLRQFRVDDKNIERTLYFATENWWIADPESCNIDSIEDSTYIIFKNQEFEMLKKSIPVFGEYIEEMHFKHLISNQKRIYDLISKTAEERYMELFESQPACVSRAPLHMIASYLGLSAETVSRVRKQIVRHNDHHHV
jgi:CRP-like cAMP-binding protein